MCAVEHGGLGGGSVVRRPAWGEPIGGLSRFRTIGQTTAAAAAAEAIAAAPAAGSTVRGTDGFLATVSKKVRPEFKLLPPPPLPPPDPRTQRTQRIRRALEAGDGNKGYDK
jgi:hypothetical protein